MPTIYQTIKGNHIISDSQEVIIRGKRYVLDLSDVQNIIAYRLSELATLGESFDFITKYYPDYAHCDEAALLDDLDCLIDNECDEEKLTRLTANWGSDPEEWKSKREDIYQQMLNGAIENYKQIF